MSEVENLLKIIKDKEALLESLQSSRIAIAADINGYKKEIDDYNQRANMKKQEVHSLEEAKSKMYELLEVLRNDLNMQVGLRASLLESSERLANAETNLAHTISNETNQHNQRMNNFLQVIRENENNCYKNNKHLD